METLSEKRARAGRLGARARWHGNHGNDESPVATRNGSRHGRWYEIRNAATSTADIYLYDEIGGWGVTAQAFIDELRDVTASTIRLFINSPGGEVFDGLAILNALRRHEAAVEVTVDGLAASAASFIAMAGDTVTMSRNSQLMIHDGLGLCIGNAADMRELADLLDRTSDNIASVYAEAAGPRGGSDDPADWRSLMRAETWFDAAEAVDAGLADRVEGAGAGEDVAARFSSMLAHFKHSGRAAAPPPVIPARAAVSAREAGVPVIVPLLVPPSENDDHSHQPVTPDAGAILAALKGR